MGKNIKIICSLVPNGKVPGNNKLGRFSLFLSPRLPDDGKLNQYYEILNWPMFSDFFKKNLKVSLKLGKIDYDAVGKTYRRSGNINYAAINYDDSFLSNIAASNPRILDGQFVWRSLFKPDTPVQEWVLDEGWYHDKVVYLNVSRQTERAAGEPAADIPPQIGSADSHVVAQAHDDMSANLLYQDEIRYKNKANQEFHKKISILADYPHLLRSTGWIVDFTVDLSLIGDHNILKLYGLELPDNLEGEKWQLFADAIDFKTPWTYFDAESFSYKYAEKYKDHYFDIKDGYILPGTASYNISAAQYRRSGKVKKISDQTKDLSSSNSSQLNAADYTNYQTYLDKQSQPDEDTSEGIQISLTAIGASPAGMVLNNQPGSDQILELPDSEALTLNNVDFKALNIDQYILFGHQIDSGYIVEVSRDNATKFHSLSERIADYSVDVSPSFAKNKTECIMKDFYDQAAISEVAVAGKTGRIYLSEDICRWNNWSLACHQNGTHPADATANDKYFEYNDLELSNIRPKPGSLLPMRFGKRYNFRIKVVDICGNAAPFEPERETPAALIKADKYVRLEQIKAPELYNARRIFECDFFKHNEPPLLKPAFTGEQLDLMAIRSVTGEPVSLKSQNEQSERTLCPQRVHFSFAETHGVFDDHWKDKKHQATVFQRAAYRVKDGSHEVFEAGTIIPFLTDPTVLGLQFKVETLSTGNDTGGAPVALPDLTINFPDNETYLSKGFVSLRLEDGENKFKPTDGSTVIFGLEKTAVAVMSVTPIFDSHDFGNVFNADPVLTKRVITLVHAVSEPYLFKTSTTLSLEVLDRKPFITNEENVKVKFNNSLYNPAEVFPISSSAGIKLRAKYDRIVIDKTHPDGFVMEAVHVATDFSNVKDSDPSVLPVLKQSSNYIGAFCALNNDLQHSFGDTLYHKVEYFLEGSSRFTHFYPEADSSDFVYVQTAGKKNVKNSKKMKGPEIFSIVPLLEWNNTSMSQERSNTKFRVYFEGNWYESGAEEKLAVIYMNDKTGTVPDELQNLVSSYGKDPSNHSNRTSGLTNDFFDPGKIIQNINYELFNIEPKTETDMAIHDGANFAGKINAAIFDVRYDVRQQRFYADIALKFPNADLQNNYMPFLKFAVAKYQEHSIVEPDYYDFRFSSVNMTPQVQQLPYRRITVNGPSYAVNGPVRVPAPIAALSGEKVFDALSEFYVIYQAARSRVPVIVQDYQHEGEANLEIALKLTGPASALHPEKSKLPDNIDFYYLEEYELYDVLDSNGQTMFESIDQDVQGYNPRDDIRKRLISSFKIKKQ